MPDSNDPNASVSDRAAQERGMQHVGEFDVVDEQRPAAQQPRVLVSFGRGTKISRRHVGE